MIEKRIKKREMRKKIDEKKEKWENKFFLHNL